MSGKEQEYLYLDEEEVYVENRISPCCCRNNKKSPAHIGYVRQAFLYLTI